MVFKYKHLFLLIFFSVTHYNFLLSQNNSFYLMIEKSEELRATDSEQSSEYAALAVEAADNMNDTQKKALAYKTLAFALYYNGNYQESLSYFQTALEQYQNIQDSSGLSSCYNGIAIIYRDLNIFSESEKYFLNALEIDTKLEDIHGQAIIMNNLGTLYHLQERTVPALWYYINSLKKEIKMNNKPGIADSYLNMAAIMEENQLFNQADFYYQKAMNIYISEGDSTSLGKIYNNLGNLYIKFDKYHKAIEAFQNSLTFKRKINDYQGQITTLLNMGNAYLIFSDTVRAKKAYLDAVRLDNEIQGTGTYLLTENNNVVQPQMDDLFFYFFNSDTIDYRFYDFTERLFNRAYIYYVLSDYKSALPFFINSLELAEFQGHERMIKQNCLYLFKTYSQLEDYKSAVFYAEKYISITDSADKTILIDILSYMPQFSDESREVPDIINPALDNENGNGLSDFWFYATVILGILAAIQFKMRKRKF
ncbi:MAG: tetratricopeptide repeat protein [Bacteroidales bacterium]|nr:tetratricopeptide repeat protein [Bacteroidales bacterium]